MIKILRDICINQPDFPKATEICVKIIRRINDEEGIKVILGLTSFAFFCRIYRYGLYECAK